MQVMFIVWFIEFRGGWKRKTEQDWIECCWEK